MISNIPLRNRLSTNEMTSTLEVFRACYEQTFNKQTNAEQRIILSWILSDVNLMIPCFSLRPDAAVKLNDSIFQNVVIRDFCLNLCFRFFALCAETDYFVSKLACTLSEALSIDNSHFDLLMVPEKIAESMPMHVFKQLKKKSWFSPSPPHVEEFLYDNKLFIIAYLIYLTDIKTPIAAA
jgi:hypothetical protein